MYGVAELLCGYLRATQRRQLILPVWFAALLLGVPLFVSAREFRTGANLAPEQAVGRRTWEEFLAENLSQRRPILRVDTSSASV